jgi:hypothetical protein
MKVIALLSGIAILASHFVLQGEPYAGSPARMTALPMAAAQAPDPTASASDSAYGESNLAATTAVPWNPPEPVATARPWETALRLPGMIATLPLSALGQLTEGTLLYVEQKNIVPQAQAVIAYQRTLGLAILPASLGDRSGIGGEIRYGPPFLNRALLFELGASLNEYNRERVAIFLWASRLEYGSHWRSREQFFGPGLGSSEHQLSIYATQSQYARFSLSFPHRAPDRFYPRTLDGVIVDPLTIDSLRRLPRSEIRLWAGPRDVILLNGRDPGNPSIEERFPAIAAGLLERRVEHFVYGVHLSRDARKGEPHWSSGWRGSIEAERFEKAIEAFAFRDAHTPALRFTRVSAYAEAGVSFFRDPRTIRLAVRAVDQEIDQGAGIFLISDLSTLGGQAGLSGFAPGRFRDVDLVLGKLTYIFPLAKHLEFDLHAEAGGVYPSLEDVQISTLQNSYGVALRARRETGPLGSVGLDWSRETVRMRFSVGGVE